MVGFRVDLMLISRLNFPINFVLKRGDVELDVKERARRSYGQGLKSTRVRRV